jgi:AraC-like DNA-binding protein
VTETSVTTETNSRWSLFRPAPMPTVAQPCSVRSMGHYRFPEPSLIDQIHPRPFVQLYWCASGRLRFGTAAGDIEIATGEVFAYPSQVWHRVRSSLPATDYWWITVDGPLADACLDAFDLRPPWPRVAGPPPERLFMRLAAVLPDPSQSAERTAAALGWELLSAASSGGAMLPDADQSVERMRRHLIEHAADPDLSISRLAIELGEDRSVLTRRFTRLVGVAPKPYLQSLRLSRAMSLLHTTDASVAAIARDCGFADPGYFSRAFREHVGMTPEQFRD